MPPSVGPCSWFCSELGLKGCELSVQWPRTYSFRPAVPCCYAGCCGGMEDPEDTAPASSSKMCLWVSEIPEDKIMRTGDNRRIAIASAPCEVEPVCCRGDGFGRKYRDPANDSLLCLSRKRDGGAHAARISTPHPHQRAGQLCLFCHRRHGGR